jgi:hypothetical protein
MNEKRQPSSMLGGLVVILTSIAMFHCSPLTNQQANENTQSPSSKNRNESTAAVPMSSSSNTQALAPAPVPKPAPPPYDLQADLKQRTEDAKRWFGPKAGISLVGKMFLVASRTGNSRGQSPYADLMDRAITAYFHGRFDKRPERAISVVLFGDAVSFSKFCAKELKENDCISNYGFYLPSRRMMVMNMGPGAGTLTHEIVHPILETDFPEAPIWINEGIASLYEAFSLPKRGEIMGHKNFRHPRLRQALNSKTEQGTTTLPELFAMSDSVFRNNKESLHYAMARYFCLWMEQKKKLWDFYHEWRDHVNDDPHGEKAFQKVMGQSISEANATWVQWAKRL